ncbi:hypothetical protein [Roseovarius nanhaiticus]|uniref:hypothetical protein n=1 Tax=Roseovarius nanhaiticus TaxID=573024 RepID=UPI00111437E5|nr:hypothetical protein [Roseovarius nanhaiticus]
MAIIAQLLEIPVHKGFQLVMEEDAEFAETVGWCFIFGRLMNDGVQVCMHNLDRAIAIIAPDIEDRNALPIGRLICPQIADIGQRMARRVGLFPDSIERPVSCLTAIGTRIGILRHDRTKKPVGD